MKHMEQEVKPLNSKEYIRELERRLKKVPEEEKDDAIAYYREYFAEAGPELEQEIIERLGSPGFVAAGIKTDVAMRSLDEGAPKAKKGLSAIWIALLGVFALPVALPVAAAVFAVALALFVSLIAVLISFYACALALTASGLFAFITGLILIPSSGSTALFYIGGGLIVLAIGVLFGIFTIWLSRVTLRGIAHRINRIRYNRAVRKGRKDAAATTRNDAAPAAYDTAAATMATADDSTAAPAPTAMADDEATAATTNDATAAPTAMADDDKDSPKTTEKEAI
jgi:uncharacterized membrane protein